MTIEDLKNDIKFNTWHDYEPMDAQYTRYIKSDPSILAVGHKINDVYHTFCDARASLLFSSYNNYGDLCADNDISKLHIRTVFLRDALIDYAICFDLSWQVIWAFVYPNSFEYFVQQDYEKIEKLCDRDNVYERLDYCIALKSQQAEKIKILLKKFDDDSTVKEVREKYNSLKHRRMLYFKGFSNEDLNKFYFDKSVNFPLQRKVHDPDIFQKLLLLYHEKFEMFFNKLINIIMPNDYMINKIGILDYVSVISEIEKYKAKQNSNKG